MSQASAIWASRDTVETPKCQKQTVVSVLEETGHCRRLSLNMSRLMNEMESEERENIGLNKKRMDKPWTRTLKPSNERRQICILLPNVN
jgi:hypothetical protein